MSNTSLKYGILENIDEEQAWELDRQLISKYGFSLNDFEIQLENSGVMRDSYWCYSVKELAYTIADKFYNMIDENYNGDYFISCKKVGKKFRIAFWYKDLVFLVDYGWTGNCLGIFDWDLISEKEFESVEKEFEDIEVVFDNDEEEY